MYKRPKCGTINSDDYYTLNKTLRVLAMSRQKRFVDLLVVLLLAAGSVTFVQGSANERDVIFVNDPTVNVAANACYAGGTMAQQCDTESEWIAGWYLIRYEYGMVSRAEVPADYRWALPRPLDERGWPEEKIEQVFPTPTPPIGDQGCLHVQMGHERLVS
jgi:hypothetical protein